MTIESRTETPGAFRQVVSVDGHTFHADVLPAIGGAGSAPGPHDVFDASLATCKALTACVYAKGHGIALDRVEVKVARDDAQERQGAYLLKVEVAFFGDLSDADKQRLHDVVGKCPIHKLMTKVEITIETAPLAT
jgi:putative redox protein